MGRLCSWLLLPVSCLILVWAAGSGSIRVLHKPTCVSDYLSVSTCSWEMDRPINCSAELHLSYLLDFVVPDIHRNYTCIPKNSKDTVCVCAMYVEYIVGGDTYKLDLWAGPQLLWTDFFQPKFHVKPRTPGNLTVNTELDMWLLNWSNPYPAGSYLFDALSYMVKVSSEEEPADVKIYNITYRDPSLRLAASTLKNGVFYTAQVRAWAESYNSSWSDWSPSVRWQNQYTQPLEQRLRLGVSVSCVVILFVCLACYFSAIKIKKEWWDQIPNPAHSPLVAIFIQEPQVSPWEKRAPGQDPAKCPRWKTCLSKLLPCLLEHSVKRDEEASKGARNGLRQGPSKAAWCPGIASKIVLWPENISVVQCVQLVEAQVPSEEETVEEDKAGSFCCNSPTGSRGFLEGREDIVARLTESLFLDLLGDQDGHCIQPSLVESSGGTVQKPQAQFLSSELTTEASEPGEATSPAWSPAGVVVVADNPAYRGFQAQSPSPAEPSPDPTLLAHGLEEVDSKSPGSSQPAKLASTLQPEQASGSWEQVLRQCLLQHGAAPAPVPTSGYRAFVPTTAEKPAGPSAEAGYKAFASLLANGSVCTETSAPGANSGEGGYRPFQELLPSASGEPAPHSLPMLTFGLDVGSPGSPQPSQLPSSSPEHLCLQPAGEGHKSPPPSPEQATEPFKDDLANGIVYSALTCHLCGHLKQCHSQEEGGQAQVVAGPCCSCCCWGEGPSPPRSPPRAPQQACLPAAPLEEGKASPGFWSTLNNAQHLSQTPGVVGLDS
ncbi:interleukin-4 receptor subunit alpha isoform X1 [Ochotona curzoniae]|uniref:interleukin-4 receptor subunit alpha isoform X1 n=1 Tax=Ochotona curzoniae TaxID=130825 RepID=UPI001B352009|nr:interleukin-4 receptor subunit alpha isoform X1 [Ochotona curzoniae]